MKKYLALGLIISLLFPYLSFAYDVESIYNEIRRDEAIKDISAIYDTSIRSSEGTLQQAKASLVAYQ
jgi:hypothetical protein